jgi:hypothetical protein
VRTCVEPRIWVFRHGAGSGGALVGMVGVWGAVGGVGVARCDAQGLESFGMSELVR